MKSVIVHAALAILGLSWAFRVWTTEDHPEEKVEVVTVIDCEAERIDGLKLKSRDREAVLEVQREGGKRRYWVTTSRKPSSGEEEREAFAGGSGVDEYLKEVLPLRATRALGQLDREALDELDLDDSKTELTVTCGGKERKFLVGGVAFGSGDRYLQDQGDHHVFLVAQTLVRELESSEFRLMQRELNSFAMTEVETLRLRAFDRDKTLKQRNRRDPNSAQWVDAADPDRRNELFGNWLERLSRLRVQKYLPMGAEPGSDLEGVSIAPVAVMAIDYLGGDAETLGNLELVRVDVPENPEYYARTPATRAWVKVLRSVAQEVEDDARPVLGLEAVQRPEPAVNPDADAQRLPVPTIEALRDLEPLAPSPASPMPMPIPRPAPARTTPATPRPAGAAE